MSKAVITESNLTAIAAAIRAKTGGSALLTPAEMATEIAGISGYDFKAFLDGSISDKKFCFDIQRLHCLAFHFRELSGLNLPNLTECVRSLFGETVLVPDNENIIVDLPVFNPATATFSNCFLGATALDCSVLLGDPDYGALIKVPAATKLTKGTGGFSGYTGNNAASKNGLKLVSDARQTIYPGYVTLYVPELTQINAMGFYYQTALETVELSKLTLIDSSAFTNCTSLMALVMDIGDTAALPQLTNTSAFQNTPIASGYGYIYITDSREKELEAATNWSNFATKIKPLSAYNPT